MYKEHISLNFIAFWWQKIDRLKDVILPCRKPDEELCKVFFLSSASISWKRVPGSAITLLFFFFFLIHIHLVGIFFQKASPECETACLELALSSLSCTIISLTTSYLTGNLGDPLNAQKLLTSPGPLQHPTCSFLAPGACSKGVSHCQGQDRAQEHARGWCARCPLPLQNVQSIGTQGDEESLSSATPAWVKLLHFLINSVAFLPFLPGTRQENQFRATTHYCTFHSPSSGNSSTVVSVIPNVKTSHNISSVFPLNQQLVQSMMCKSISAFFQGVGIFLVIILTFLFVEK